MSCHPLLQKSRVIQPPIMELSVPPHTQREDVITFKSDSEGVSNLGEVWDIKMKDIDQKDEIGVTNKDGIRRKNVTAPYELGSGPPYYYFSDYAVVKSIRAAARRKVEVEMMGESDCANKEGIGCRETAQDHNDDGMGKNKGSLSARRARWYSQILSQKMRVIERRCAGGDVIGGIDSLGSTADLDGKVTSQPIGTENGSSPSMFLSEVVRSKCNDFCDDIFAVNCKCTCAYPHDPQCPLLDSSQPHSSPSFSSLDLSLLEADAHWRALECVIETQTRAGAGVYNATADYHAKRIVCRRRDEGIAPTTHPHRMNSCHREVFEGGSNSVVNPTVKRTRSHYPDDFIDDTFAQQDNKQNKGRRTEECKSAIKTESLPIKESREDDTICLAQHHYNTRDDDVIKGIIDHCIKKSSTSPTSCQAGFVGPGDIHISNTHSTLKSSLHTAHYLPNTPDIMSLEHMLFTFDNNNNSKKPPSWDSEYSLLWGATTTKNGIDDCRSSSDKMPQEIYSCSKGDSEKRGPSVWHVSDRVEPSSIPLMSSSMGLTPDLIASGHLSNAHAHSLRVEIEEKLDEVLNGDPLAIACTCNDTRRALEVLREHLIKSVVLRKALARRQATLQMLQRLYSEELCPVLGCEKMETALIEKDIRHC